MRNLRADLEFDGARYSGWQYQPNRPTIQGELESALSRVLQSQSVVYGCGRTDAGVSARCYVANFHADSALPTERLRSGVNHYLPKDIHVRTIKEAPPGFHARFSAREKTYLYHVLLAISPLRRHHAWEYRFPLDVERMRKAVPLFQGSKDFQRFCRTRDANGKCTVKAVTVSQIGDEIQFSVCGDRFLYKMVRRIVGALVACGSGRLTQRDIRAALAGKPHPPFQTAPAQGLLLDSVAY